MVYVARLSGGQAVSNTVWVGAPSVTNTILLRNLVDASVIRESGIFIVCRPSGAGVGALLHGSSALLNGSMYRVDPQSNCPILPYILTDDSVPESHSVTNLTFWPPRNQNVTS